MSCSTESVTVICKLRETSQARALLVKHLFCKWVNEDNTCILITYFSIACDLMWQTSCCFVFDLCVNMQHPLMIFIRILFNCFCASSPVEILSQRAALWAREEGGAGCSLSDCEYLIGSLSQSSNEDSLNPISALHILAHCALYYVIWDL